MDRLKVSVSVELVGTPCTYTHTRTHPHPYILIESLSASPASSIFLRSHSTLKHHYLIPILEDDTRSVVERAVSAVSRIIRDGRRKHQKTENTIKLAFSSSALCLLQGRNDLSHNLCHHPDRPKILKSWRTAINPLQPYKQPHWVQRGFYLCELYVRRSLASWTSIMHHTLDLES